MRYIAIAMLLLCLGINLSGQGEDVMLQNISTHLEEDSNFIIDPSDLTISSTYHNKKGNYSLVYLQQNIQSIPIYNALGVAVLDSRLNIIRVNHTFHESADVGRIATTYSVEECLMHCLQGYQQKSVSALPASQKLKNGYIEHIDKAVSEEPMLSKTIFYKAKKGGLVLAHEINIWNNKTHKWEQYIVSSKDKTLIDQGSWTIECDHHSHKHCNRSQVSHASSKARVNDQDSSYNVLPLPFESPLHGARDIEIAPWNLAPQASPFGWHDLDGIAGSETTTTFGNNVKAYEDRDDNDQPPAVLVDGGTNLCFDFPFNHLNQPETYIDASTVNLFYWNNLIHDIMYNYGFDEGSGNFQNTNYSEAGLDGDYVNAEAQDGSGTNNANMSTPPDGSRPRMQMYVWNTEPNIFEVVSPQSISESYEALPAEFGPSSIDINGSLVLADSPEACDSLLNESELLGNIALIDRGSCLFYQKLARVETAGAIGAVICNNVEDPIFPMINPSDTIITIPSIMISKSDCDYIKAALPEVTVNIAIGDQGYRDSGFDNGVIIHEYGHGISIRLTGGPNNVSCLRNSEQMGEGWSDYFGLILTMDANDIAEDGRGIGSYVLGENINGDGIRPLKYSRDFMINDHTYNAIRNLSVPHGLGSVWCAMLWDLTWNLIDVYGYDPDIYAGTGGNNIALQLVMDGLKLQPCNPGFVDGRDAILLADELANNGANRCLIWETFARRGLGYGADQGSTGSTTDGVESFDIPLFCNEILGVEKTAPKLITYEDTISYTVFGFNNTGEIINSVSIVDTLSSQLTIVPGSIQGATESNGVITISLPNFETRTDTAFTLKAIPTNTEVVVDYYEDFEGESTWQANSLFGSIGFEQVNTNPNNGVLSWFIENSPTSNSHTLESQEFLVNEENVLSLWHYYNTESSWDGGLVQYSTNGGTEWLSLADHLLLGGYNTTFRSTTNEIIASKQGWSGNSGGYINSIISLHHLEGETVTFRFLFASDSSVSSVGWYIDDIALLRATEVQNVACINGESAATYCDTTTTYFLRGCTEFYKHYIDQDNDGFGIDQDSIYSCNEVESGYSTNKMDCDDENPEINPTAVEIPENGIDENCNGFDYTEEVVGDSCADDLPVLLPLVNDAKVCVESSNVFAVSEDQDCLQGIASVWYKVITDDYTNSLTITVEDASFDPIISVIQAETCDGLSQSANNQLCLKTTNLTIDVQSNTTYFVRVSLAEGTLGDYTFCVEANNDEFFVCYDGSITVERPEYPELSVNDAYYFGETVLFCVDLTFNVAGSNCQWLQGILPIIYNGWDLEINPVSTQDGPQSFGGESEVQWLDEGNVDYNFTNENYRIDTLTNGKLKIEHLPDSGPYFETGTLLPAGWWISSQGGGSDCTNTGDPDTMWGDAGNCSDDQTYNFCFELTARTPEDITQCENEDFKDLRIELYMFGDGETGCFESATCTVGFPIAFDGELIAPPDYEEIVYNGIDDDCNPLTLDDDLDQDGYPLAEDCDDQNPDINPGVHEICDGIDNDCNDLVDDLELITYYFDEDEDGFGDPTNSQSDCEPLEGYVTNNLDCDDADSEINPDSVEITYNGIDDDCDPNTLDDDLDQDGYLLEDDCDDTNPNINPEAEEICDNLDNDCNEIVDDISFITYYLDEDGDGYGDLDKPIFDCREQDGYVINSDDCDDNNVNIFPGAIEVPYNGIDDDCDVMTLDDDLDSDGIVLAYDCDDTDADINPDMTEVPYNGIDDDCDPLTLDDDLDGDGYVLADDCDDTDANINPGQTEVTYNGIDEDCDPLTLDDDLDGDGFVLADDCDDTNAGINASITEIPYNGIDDDCNPLTLDDDLDGDGYVLADDCDDTDANINPGQTEIPYNGIDDDCDPLTLDDDLDGDGYVLVDDCDDTNAGINTSITEIPYNGIDDDCDLLTLDDDLDGDGYVLADDCDDTNPNININEEETPYNGIDDDCNPLTLDDDLDQDGFVLADDCDDTNPNVNSDQEETPYNGIDDDCNPVTLDDDLDQDGFVLVDDCDDTNPNVNSDQIEVPYNGIDEDCDPLTLDDDLDGDGFVLEEDCDDNNANVNLSIEEVPYNGIDDDCNSETLDDDLDQDGFVLADDCDDTNPNINTAQVETPYNGVDEDCNPNTLDDDLDQDGFVLAEDCDDTNPGINPDAEDIPNNGIDEDCDGEDATSDTFEFQGIEINIHPNPVNDILFVNVPKSKEFNYLLYDIYGKSINIIVENGSVDMSQIQSGTYLLQVIDQVTNDYIFTRIVVAK